MMNITAKLLALAAASALALGSQSAWAADNASADTTVTLVTPIQVSKTSDLAFGQVAIPSTGGTATTVAISTGGAQTGTADFVGAQTTTAAVFGVVGQGTLAYTPTITVTDAGATGLSLSAFNGKCGAGSDQALTLGSGTGLTGCALAAGADTISVGGTLTVASDASSGAATPGAIAVTVAYN
jgi:hypothetical protein